MPIIYNKEGKIIQLTYGPLDDKDGAFRVPDGTEAITDKAFMKQSFKKIILPYTIKSIGDSAFENCKMLATAELTSATSIGNSAFAGCTALTRSSCPP